MAHVMSKHAFLESFGSSLWDTSTDKLNERLQSGEQLLPTILYPLTISFLSKARAASRFAGLFASRLSVLFRPRLKSSWIMVFFTYILSISLHDPPLELSSPLRLLGSGGRPSIQASMPPAAPFPTLPFILTFTNNTLCLQTRVQ